MKRNQNSRPKTRLLAYILTMAMILSYMPFAALAADPACGHYSALPANNAQQILQKNGNYLYYGDGAANGTTNPVRKITNSKAPGLYINMSKSIKETAVENEFLITLDVETNSVVENNARSDAAVVIVLDISGSMLKNQTSGGSLQNYSVRRLTKAVNAINTFVENFADVRDMSENPIPGERWVSIVAFGSSNNIVLLRDWVNVGNETGVAKTGTQLDNAKLVYTNTGNSSVGTLTGNPTLSTSQMTCISGGLNRALTQLNSLGSKTSKAITSTNTILFTDGEPNQHDGNGNPPSGTYGGSDNYYKWAEVRAASVRGISNLFTVAYGSTTHTNWLRDWVASNPAYNFAGGDNLNLNNVFTVINNQISMLANAWNVTDPMGKYIDYVGLVSSNHASGAVSEAAGTLNWDLKKETADLSKPGVSKYKLTYKIRLNTAAIEASDWQSGDVSKYLPTNGTTTLTYTFEKTGNSKPLVSGSADFLIPQVKGYRADFGFNKTDPDGLPLNGFKFLLKSGSWQQEAVSASGAVSFQNILSAREYTLSEVNFVPDEYVGVYRPSTETYDVVVSYGEVFLFPAGTAQRTNAKVIAHFNTSCGKKTFSFVNPYDAGTLTINKNDIGSAPYFQTIAADTAFEITVTFSGSDAALAKIEAPVGFTKSDGSAAGTAVYTGTIAVGGSAIFPLVPAGVTYDVAETDPGSAYAAPTYDAPSGTIAATGNTVNIGNKMYASEGSTVTKDIVSGDPQGPFAPGEQVIFTVVVTNTGGYNITNLEIVDKINGTGSELAIKWINPDGDEEAWTNEANGAMTIIPGGAETFKVYYTVTGEEGANPYNRVDAKITYSTDSTEDKYDEEPFEVKTPDVTIAKSLLGELTRTDDGYVATYQLVVTNSGTATAYNVTVSDSMSDISSAPGSGWSLGTITMENSLTYTSFSAIPAFTLAAGGTETITYTVTFALNEWDSGDMLTPEKQAELDAWLTARDEYEAARAAFEAAVGLYELAVQAAKDTADAAGGPKDAMDAAKAVLDPLESNYLAAQGVVDSLYAQEANGAILFEQAMQKYLEDLIEYQNPTDPENPSVPTEPVMPYEGDFLVDNSAAIAVAEQERDIAYGLYITALDEYNNTAAAYADALKVDRNAFNLPTLESAYNEKLAAFEALGDLSVEFDLANLPGPHNYSNTAGVTHALTAGGSAVGPNYSQPVPVTVDPKIVPNMTINKLVSVDGGSTWNHVAAFPTAAGGTAMFKMTIKNIGLAPITGITWQDIFDGAGVSAVNADGFTGTLGVNETYTFTWETALDNIGNFTALSKTNVFSVTIPGAEADSSPETKDASATVIVPADTYPLVSILKEVKVGSDAWGKHANVVSDSAQDFKFRFTLTNDGTRDAEVNLSDTFSYMNFNGTAYVGTGINVTIDLGADATVTVPAGGTVFVYATLTGVNPGEYIVNKVTASYEGGEPDESEASVSVTPLPKAYFSVEKLVVIEAVSPDNPTERLADTHNITSDDAQTLTYKITIQNRGSVDGDVIITDTLTALAGGRLFLDADLTAQVENPYTITVPSFGTVDLYYVVTGATAGTYKNTAEITLPDGSPNVIVDGEDDATVIIRSIGKAQLTLNKEVRPAGSNADFSKALTQSVSSASGTVNVEFRITVTNTGLAAVKISENALTDMMVNSQGADVMSYITGGLDSLKVSFTLEPGESKPFHVLATIPVGSFTNTATLTSGEVEPVVDGDTVLWPAGSEDSISSSATVTVTVSGPGPGPGPGPDPDPDPILIPDPEVPRAPAPEVDSLIVVEEDVPLVAMPEPDGLIIIDEDVPLGNLPQTSSTSTAGIMAALFGLLAVLGLGGQLRRKEEDEI